LSPNIPIDQAFSASFNKIKKIREGIIGWVEQGQEEIYSGFTLSDLAELYQFLS